jgi:thymidine phosphorylase
LRGPPSAATMREKRSAAAPLSRAARARAVPSVASTHKPDSGAAAERFSRMVAALGGPRNVLSARFAGLPKARCVMPLPSPGDGVIAATDTREIGLAVVALGGGRRVSSDKVDPRVGLSHILPLGTRVGAGEPLMHVHASSRDAAQLVMSRLTQAMRIAPRPPGTGPAVIERLGSR